MTGRDPELHDPHLTRALKQALGGEAPSDWVRDALAVPSAPVPGFAEVPKREPWIAFLLPHLVGLALLVGFALATLLQPQVFRGLGTFVEGLIARSGSGSSLSQPLMLAMLSTPVLLWLLVEGSRGFPHLRR